MSKQSSNTTMTVTSKVYFHTAAKGAMRLRPGTPPAPSLKATGRVPRVARLMALAIRFEGMIQRGEVKDYAELARLGHVTRARVTQVMNLLNLAPDLQEAILFLPPVTAGHDPVKEWQVRPVATEAVWGRQRKQWAGIIPSKR